MIILQFFNLSYRLPQVGIPCTVDVYVSMRLEKLKNPIGDEKPSAFQDVRPSEPFN
jgi:hypothetical protein